jgi:ElaB/YqjD/DUF883 family membrane-anchored ribosome-binding protein
MANQKFRNEPSQPATSNSAAAGSTSRAGGVKQHAAESASTMVSQVQGVLDQQVAKGARIVANVANSTRRAAKELETETPQIAGLVRGMADHLEDYSRNLEHQSVTDVYQAASNFTRQQPALVFGVAALAGFFTLRTLRSSPTSSRPASVSRHRGGSQREGFHGS